MSENRVMGHFKTLCGCIREGAMTADGWEHAKAVFSGLQGREAYRHKTGVYRQLTLRFFKLRAIGQVPVAYRVPTRMHTEAHTQNEQAHEAVGVNAPRGSPKIPPKIWVTGTPK
jgi:hypothetical protein